MVWIPMEQQRIADLAHRNSRAEQETLALLASEPAQDVKLFLGLDALGQRHEAQAVSYIDCGPDQFL